MIGRGTDRETPVEWLLSDDLRRDPMSNRFLILMFVATLVPGLSALAAEDDQIDPKLAERARLSAIVSAQQEK